jgi:copper chaperone CopZ
MEKVEWKVEGMTCSNCALSVTKLLQKEGMQNVMVNPIDGQVRFDATGKEAFNQIKSGIHKLGYSVVEEGSVAPEKKGFLQTHKQRFLFTLPFTLILMLHMLHGIIPLHALMNPWIQLALCLPVFLLGMNYFGASAIRSLKLGIPNMNVLVALGAAAAFVYSLIGAIYGYGQDYLFFETSASIKSPVLSKKFKSVVRAITIIAPVLFFDIEIHALTIGEILAGVGASDFQFQGINLRVILSFPVKELLPITSKNLLTSCWKTIINARTPTLINCPKIAPNNCISRIFTNNHHNT